MSASTPSGLKGITESVKHYLPFLSSDGSAAEFLTIPVIWLFSFLALPIIMMVTFSFVQVQNYQVVFEPTLQNYRTVLTSSVFQQYFINTVQIALSVTVLVFLLGYPLAYAINYKAKHPELWLLLVLGPFFTVYLIRAFSWISILGRQGAINSFLMWLGLLNEPLGWLLYGKTAVILGLAHAYLPYFVLTLYATLQGLDDAEIEAARDLGAGSIRAFWDITFPQSLPGVVTGILFVFIPSLGAYVTPLLLGGGTTPMLAPLLEQYLQLTLNISKASAGGMVMLVIVAVATAIIFRIVDLEDLFSGRASAGGDTE